MSKPLYIVLFILYCYNIGLGQVTFFHNRFLSEQNVVLVGPLNVDMYFIGQSDFYLGKLEDYGVKLNDIIEETYSKIEIENSRKFIDQSQVDFFHGIIEKTLLQIEVVELYTLDWEIHKDQFLEWVNAYALVHNKKDCLSFDIDDNVYSNSEIEIFLVDKNVEVFYNEYVFDELQMVTRTIDKNQVQEIYKGTTFTDNVKLNGILKPYSINSIKIDSLANKSLIESIRDEMFLDVEVLKPRLSRSVSHIYFAMSEFVYNKETLVCEKTVSAQSTEASFYVVIDGYDLKVPSRVRDTCED